MKAPLYVLSWRTSLEPTSRLEQTHDRSPQLSPPARHQLSEFNSHANYERCRYSPVSRLCARRQCSARHAAFPPTREIGPRSRRTRRNVWQLSSISCVWRSLWKVCRATLRSLCAPPPLQSARPNSRPNEKKPHTPCHPQLTLLGKATYILLGPACPS
jgi:hypothetical protein